MKKGIKATGSTHPFEHVSTVTDEHVETFVEEFFDRVRGCNEFDEAISESGVMTWPTAPDTWQGSESTPEQDEYLEAQTEILAKMSEILRPALEEAFRAAVTDVLRLRRRADAA